MWPHVHLIPRRKGDTPNPKGGVRGVIPMNQDYDDTTEDDWEKKETRVVMGVCFGERDDTTMKTERFKKVDDDVWDKVVQRMRDNEKKQWGQG